jgi:ER membrane protein complex subunit 8/9
MVTYTLSHTAYLKIFFHAAKYPHRTVNGVLVGEEEGSKVNIVDAIPLLHHWTHLSPMMEIGLDLVSSLLSLLRSHSLGAWAGEWETSE